MCREMQQGPAWRAPVSRLFFSALAGVILLRRMMIKAAAAGLCNEGARK
jgi:hypothetical protein